MRVAEAVAVALAVSITCYLLSVHGGTCQPILDATVPTDTDPYTALRRMGCPEDEYNDMGSLAFTSWDRAIRNLFHFNRPGTFTPATLTIFFVLYFFFACYTYGLWVPSGLFIPRCAALALCPNVPASAARTSPPSSTPTPSAQSSRGGRVRAPRG